MDRWVVPGDIAWIVAGTFIYELGETCYEPNAESVDQMESVLVVGRDIDGCGITDRGQALILWRSKLYVTETMWLLSSTGVTK